MGTLHNQNERRRSNIDELEVILTIVDSWARDLTEYEALDIALRYREQILREAQTNLDQDNRDTWDEQISGLGLILESLVSAIDEVSEKLEK